MSTPLLWVYGYRVMSADPNKPVKTSFSLYKSDKRILNDLVVGLKREGVKVRAGTVLRALAHLNSGTEMFAAAVLLDRDLNAKAGPREADTVDFPPPTADLPQRDRDKMERVSADLLEKEITSSHSFIMRALLRSCPDIRTMAPLVRKFLQDVPRRTRTMAPKAPPHGRR